MRLLFSKRITSGTILPMLLGITCIGICPRMRCCNFFLCYQNLVTNRAMLALGQARFGTSGCDRCVDFLGMAKRCNFFLCNKDLATYRAMLSLGQACRGAGRSYCLIHGLGVSECAHDFLCNEYFVTYRAVRSFRQACLSTSGLYGSINSLCMSQCGSKLDFADQASLICGTGGCNTRGVTVCGHQLLSASRAALRIGTGRLGTGSMSKRSNLGLCNQYFIAYRAMLALGQAGCGTGGRDCLIHDLGVAKSIDALCFGLTAFAGALLLPCLGTGRVLDRCPIAKRMHVRLCFGLCFRRSCGLRARIGRLIARLIPVAGYQRKTCTQKNKHKPKDCFFHSILPKM